MKWYTKDHVWLQPDNDTGKLLVGITQQGNDAMGGITYVEAVDGKLVVESAKKSIELELPVKGELMEVAVAPPDDWTTYYVFTVFEPGYELDTSQCMDEEAYRKYVE